MNIEKYLPGLDAKKAAIWLAVICSLTFIVYTPGLKSDIVNWDDSKYVTEHPQKTITIKNITAAFSEYFMGNYHPLAMLSLSLDHQLFHGKPSGFHFTNIVLHTLNTALVFILVLLLLSNLTAAIVAAGLFGLHTFHVESVAWISERKDVLYGLFYLASLSAYVFFIKQKEKKAYYLALGLFLLSLLSKGQAVALTLTLPLVDYFAGRNMKQKNIWTEKIPFIILSVVFGIIAILAQREAEATGLNKFPLYERIAFASYSLTNYLGKLIFPYKLSAFYPYPPMGVAIPAYYYVFLIPAGLYLLLMLYAFKRQPILFFGMGFFLANAILILQLLPVGDAIMADRYSYMPSVGFVFIAGAFLSKYIENKKTNQTAIAAVVIYSVILGVMTFQRTQIWNNSVVLWNDVVKKYDQIPLAWYNLGQAKQVLEKYDTAIIHYSQALELNRYHKDARANRGYCHYYLKNYTAALADFDQAINDFPDFFNVYINRAALKRDIQDFAGAIADYTAADKIKPGKVEVLTSRGNTYLDLQDYAAAAADFEKAIATDPFSANAYYGRAAARKATNDLNGAIADYDMVIKLNPSLSEAYNNRGNLKYRLNDLQGAVNDYSEAIKINASDHIAWKNRGSVKHMLNDYKGAADDYLQALKINPNYAEAIYGIEVLKPLLAKQGITIEIPGEKEKRQYAELNRQGLILASQGKTEEAADLYKKATVLLPDMPEAYYNLGNLIGRQGQFAQAIDYFNKAIERKPDYADAFSNRGIAKASSGNIQQALLDFNQAIRLAPDNANSYFNRAIAYYQTGQKANACSDLKKATDLGHAGAATMYKRECAQ